jgi:hypothetical protein
MNETEVRNANEFETWFTAAAPGDRCVYHRGHLAADGDDDKSTVKPSERLRIKALAKLTWGLQCRRGVLLTQRREGDVCAYLATATRRNRPGAEMAIQLQEAA